MFYRLGLAVVRLRWLVVAVWAVAVLAALPFAPRAPEALSPGGFTSDSMESQQAVNALSAGLHTTFTNVQIIFSSDRLTADDPTFVQQATLAVEGLRSWNEVTGIVPFTANPTAVSRSRHAAYTLVLLRSDPDHAPGVLPELRRRLRQPASLAMTVGGGPVFYSDIQSVSEADLRRAELIAFPFATLALLLVFRSVVAAALPVAVGGCSVVVSLAMLFGLASASPVSIFALNITTLFGLGLGVDYSLFMVSRFREELRRGLPVDQAIGVVMSTAGRAVFFSGLAVSIGLLGLMLFPLNMLRSVGMGGMLTVVLAILAAVTLLPALLGILGTRVNALPVRLPFVHRRSAADLAPETSGFWHGLASGVMRRPVATLVPVLALLLLLGVPFLSVRLAAPDASILPASVKSRAAYDLLSRDFDQSALSPIVIAVRTPGSPLSARNLDALDVFVRTLQADPRVQGVTSIVSLDPRLTLDQYKLLYSNPAGIADPYITQVLQSYAGPDVTMVQVTSKYGMLDPRSEALVQSIRATRPPDGLSILTDGGTG
ncbi:MAG TPA: MMPL family transporter, partial [Dehalococcoidia bacterium]|nr:MMPL family transporter [Dehalococcoidia bacterium]